MDAGRPSDTVKAGRARAFLLPPSCPRIPKGFKSFSPGLAAPAGYPGFWSSPFSTLKGLHQRRCMDSTLSGLRPLVWLPRVAAPRLSGSDRNPRLNDGIPLGFFDADKKRFDSGRRPEYCGRVKDTQPVHHPDSNCDRLSPIGIRQNGLRLI